MNLPVNEIFSSIQGEGSFTGTPAVFVRLQFCQILCGFCDTKHTWEKKEDQKISFDEMLAKKADAETWADVDVGTLVEYLAKQPEELIVITGGEPANYDLVEFTTQLLEYHKRPQIETSGTLPIKVNEYTFITVSPKINMPGGFKLLPEALHMADEIKMPVGKMADVLKLKSLIEEGSIFEDVEVFLQPLSQSVKATELCIEQARLNGWRISAQLHKYLHLR